MAILPIQIDVCAVIKCPNIKCGHEKFEAFCQIADMHKFLHIQQTYSCQNIINNQVIIHLPFTNLQSINLYHALNKRVSSESKEACFYRFAQRFTWYDTIIMKNTESRPSGSHATRLAPHHASHQ